jgi:hypothetical protein
MPGADAATLEASHYQMLQNIGDKEIVSLDLEVLKAINLEVRRRTADWQGVFQYEMPWCTNKADATAFGVTSRITRLGR